MTTFWTRAALVAATMMAAPLAAQELTEEQQGQAAEFAVSNSLFVFYHEIGHLFVGEFGLPVLGKEEDAADILASVILLDQKTEDSSMTLMDAADGWTLMENSKAGDAYEDADLYDEHSLDIQRAFQVVCLMVGADPAAFADIAAEYGMDPERQDSCGADYDQAAASWGGLLDPHKASGTAAPKISITYEPAGDDFADIEQLLKDRNFLETLQAAVDTKYALPRDLKFRATQCNEENAFYDPENAEIVFCYEMAALFFELAAGNLLAPPSGN